MSNLSKLSLLLLIFFIIVFGGASVLKSANLLANDIRQIEKYMGGAIYLHFTASLLLGALCRLSCNKSIWLGLPPTTLLVLTLVSIDELIQQVIPSRHFSLIDMSVNIIGLLLGSYLLSFVISLGRFSRHIFLSFIRYDG